MDVCTANLITSLVGPTLPPGPIGLSRRTRATPAPRVTDGIDSGRLAYRWLHVVLFSIATALLHVVGILAPPCRTRFNPRDVGDLDPNHQLLVVGYWVCIMSRLLEQTASLTQANLQLRHYNSTLEQLAVSHEHNRVPASCDTLAHTLSGLTVQWNNQSPLGCRSGHCVHSRPPLDVTQWHKETVAHSKHCAPHP